MKSGVILLALLLAAMAMVPLVSAVDPGSGTLDEKEGIALAISGAQGPAAQGLGNGAGAILAKEITVTGSLNPARTTGTSMSIPWGATVEHSLIAGIPVTLVYDKDGDLQYWADDRQATEMTVFQDMRTPATRVHEVPAGTVIDHTIPGIITASDPETKEIIVKIIDRSGTPLSRNPVQTLVGICRENKGCYVADISGSDAFTSQPFSTSLDYAPKFSRIYNEKLHEMNMSVTRTLPEGTSTSADITRLSAVINPLNLSSPRLSAANASGFAVLEIPCGWIGVSPRISSSGMAVTYGSWINWVWNPLAGVPTVDVDFHNQLLRDYGSGYTQLIASGQYKSYSGVGLVGVTDSNTYTVSSAGDYFTLTTMDWQVPSSATCIPASGSGMFQTYPNLAVP